VSGAVRPVSAPLIDIRVVMRSPAVPLTEIGSDDGRFRPQCATARCDCGRRSRNVHDETEIVEEGADDPGPCPSPVGESTCGIDGDHRWCAPFDQHDGAFVLSVAAPIPHPRRGRGADQDVRASDAGVAVVPPRAPGQLAVLVDRRQPGLGIEDRDRDVLTRNPSG